MLTVKVLGFGCFKCQRLEQETRAALAAMTPNILYEIIRVTEPTDRLAYGILSTPALVINEKVVSVGRIPKREQIVSWARELNAS